ncbi:MAG: hypothetical protein MZW92_63575 [Comamonadaceae bacterium]|nr:hypothetical protein [Comamonadaceae bacterium]
MLAIVAHRRRPGHAGDARPGRAAGSSATAARLAALLEPARAEARTGRLPVALGSRRTIAASATRSSAFVGLPPCRDAADTLARRRASSAAGRRRARHVRAGPERASCRRSASCCGSSDRRSRARQRRHWAGLSRRRSSGRPMHHADAATRGFRAARGAGRAGDRRRRAGRRAARRQAR